MAKKHIKPLPVEDPPSDDEEVETSEEEESEEKLQTHPCPAAEVQPLVSQKTTNKKRQSDGTSSNASNAKRAKQEDRKTSIYQSLWSEEDEILLLQGVIDFGKCPFEDKNGFHESVKGSISIEVSTNQLMEKIRSLKSKFIGKGRKGVPYFPGAHDQTCFEMSNYLWGPNGIVVQTRKSETSNAKKKNNNKVVEEELILGEDWFEKSYLVGSVARFGVTEESVKARWNKLPMEEKKRIEEKWKALQFEDVRFVLLKTKLLHDAASAIS